MYVVADLMTQVPKPIWLIVSVVMVVLGGVRLFRLIPHLGLNPWEKRRPNNPVVDGGLWILGGVLMAGMTLLR